MSDRGSWLEVVEPSASEKQVLHWGADSLFLGMRVALDGRQQLTAGRGARDELKCGLIGSQNSVVQLKLNAKGRWVAHAKARTTTINDKPIGPGGHVLANTNVIDGGAVAFRYHHDDVDPLLGVAWRVNDLVMFAAPFLGPRWFRALDLSAMRVVTAFVADPHHEDIRGRAMARWRGSDLFVLDDIHGPTLREIFARSLHAGGDVDPSFLAALCEDVNGPVGSMDDVAVRFDGAVVSTSLSTKTIGEPGARLKSILKALGKKVDGERMNKAGLAGVVRSLFPAEAERSAAIAEEALLLDAEAWRARVPETAR